MPSTWELTSAASKKISDLVRVDAADKVHAQIDQRDSPREPSTRRAEPAMKILRGPGNSIKTTDVQLQDVEPVDLQRRADQEDALFRPGRTAAMSPKQLGRVAHGIVVEEHVAAGAAGQPFAQQIGIGAAVDAYQSAKARNGKAKAKLHAGQGQADADQRHKGGIAVGQRLVQAIGKGADAQNFELQRTGKFSRR